jgi:tRNA 2-thiouridine synthesizing protein A
MISTKPFRNRHPAWQQPAAKHRKVMSQSTSHDAAIDITADVCPMTFVRTRLALDRLSSGQVLLVRLRGEEPRRNVPETARQQGHVVLDQQEEGGGILNLWLKKG